VRAPPAFKPHPRQGSAAAEHVMRVIDLHARHGQPIDEGRGGRSRWQLDPPRTPSPSSASPLPKRATVAVHPARRLAHNVRCSEVDVVARCAGRHARRGRLVVVTDAASRRGCVQGMSLPPSFAPFPQSQTPRSLEIHHDRWRLPHAPTHPRVVLKGKCALGPFLSVLVI
jgi:hypothetical protein